MDEARKIHVMEYCRLDPDHPPWVEDQMTVKEREAVGLVTLARLKQCLNEGYPVCFGFNYYWGKVPWTQYEDTRNKRNLQYLAPLASRFRHSNPPNAPNGGSFGGHSILAIGYDEDDQVIYCQNSWGAERRVFVMDYSWITGKRDLPEYLN
jgi:C1A family cysteine protease